MTVSSSTLPEARSSDAASSAAMAVTAFICANCCRPGMAPDSGGRPRPAVPDFGWPFPIHQVLVACTGRLQPEHVLKAFEAGADLVVTVSCEEDNCQYLEGSSRWAGRVDYVRGMLDEIGLGGERLLHFHLPGTAAQDMALGAGTPVTAGTEEDRQARIAAVRDSVLRSLRGLTPNPLTPLAVAVAEETYQPADTSDEENED